LTSLKLTLRGKKNGSKYTKGYKKLGSLTAEFFISYQESTANKAEGILVAPFTEIHGWYWKNESSKFVTVTVKTKGQYRAKGLS